MKLKRGEYADFIRAITPLIVDLFELVIKKELKIDINKYCDQKKQNGTIVRKWSVKKLNGSEIGNTLIVIIVVKDADLMRRMYIQII